MKYFGLIVFTSCFLIGKTDALFTFTSPWKIRLQHKSIIMITVFVIRATLSKLKTFSRYLFLLEIYFLMAHLSDVIFQEVDYILVASSDWDRFFQMATRLSVLYRKETKRHTQYLKDLMEKTHNPKFFWNRSRICAPFLT